MSTGYFASSIQISALKDAPLTPEAGEREAWMSTSQEEVILPNPPPPRPIARSVQKARARAATAVTAPVEGVGRSGDEALEARASALPESRRVAGS
jgi:hypothetical protein